jgi:1-acyl-sn-glycerol-3-phosphate acyltransferase
MIYTILKIIVGLVFKLFYPIKAEGLENIPHNNALILVANHCSYFDPLFLGLVIPRRIHWMVLRPYYNLWWLRWLFKVTECFPVNIDKPNIEAIKYAIKILNEGKVLGIFPEGARSKDGRLKEGKKGVAFIALKTGAPILPVAIDGAFEAYPVGKILPKPHSINVKIGHIFNLDEFTKNHIDKQNLQAATEKIMNSIKRLMS